MSFFLGDWGAWLLGHWPKASEALEVTATDWRCVPAPKSILCADGHFEWSHENAIRLMSLGQVK